MPASAHDLRCFCSRKPLLAKYGTDAERKPYIHLKVYKQTRMFGEFIFHGGIVRIRCRECLRWHTVTFRAAGEVRMQQEELPPGVAV